MLTCLNIAETSASTKAVATPRQTVYTVDEGVGTVNIWFEFVDPNNDIIPLEENLGVGKCFIQLKFNFIRFLFETNSTRFQMI